MRTSVDLRRRWQQVAAAAATAVVASAVLAVPAGAAQAQAQAGCLDVAYQATVWHTGPDTGGFVANVTLTNTCDTAGAGWVLVLTLPPGHQVNSVWNAQLQQSGQEVVFSNMSWNGAIPPGGSIQFGFTGTFTGGYQDPIGCTINGVECWGGGNQPPEVTLTSPADGQLVPSPCAITLAADAVDPDGGIDRVEFYVNDQLFGTVGSAPYELPIQVGHPAVQLQGNEVFARAYDNGDPPLSTDSAPATFGWVIPPPALMMIACPSQLELEEDSSAQVRIANLCGDEPAVEVQVSGDAGITAAPSSFTLAAAGQELTITAAPGSAGAQATVTTVADACIWANIQVTVAS